MDGELKTFEELLKLMPSEWERKARELGVLKRSREIRDAKDLLPVNFPCLDRHAVVRQNGGTPVVGRNYPSDQERGL
jgi:hypothetical protein